MFPRLPVAALFAAACGRIAFEAPSDAEPPLVDCTIAANGTPCDDDNICTDASACLAGACVPAMPQTMCTVADSDTDFSDTQGANGFWYGTWVADVDPSYDVATDFVLAEFTGAVWSHPGSPTAWPYTANWGGHPDGEPMNVAVRRWISDVSGPALVSISVDKADIGCGDGSELQLVVDGAIRWARELAFDDGIAMIDTVPLQLSVGMYVEMHLRPNVSDACDATNYTMKITNP